MTGFHANVRHALSALTAAAAILAAGAVQGGSAAQAADDAFEIVSLAAHSQDPGVRILDVRTSVAEYQNGHVPGAVFLANDALRAPLNGVPVQYLELEQMAWLFARAGVSARDQVVVYADGADVLGATMIAYRPSAA